MRMEHIIPIAFVFITIGIIVGVGGLLFSAMSKETIPITVEEEKIVGENEDFKCIQNGEIIDCKLKDPASNPTEDVIITEEMIITEDLNMSGNDIDFYDEMMQETADGYLEQIAVDDSQADLDIDLGLDFTI